MSMFCNQCQETAKNTGCTIKGVCGKSEETSNIQDLLIYACMGLSRLTIEARKKGIGTNNESRHITNSLFITITNANYDNEAIIGEIKKTLEMRDNLKTKVTVAPHDCTEWSCDTTDEFYHKIGRASCRERV